MKDHANGDATVLLGTVQSIRGLSLACPPDAAAQVTEGGESMGARADDTAEAGFALLTLLVNGREYEVIYVDFTSHLLTTDAFLLEATKVSECAPLHLHTCYTLCTTPHTLHSIISYPLYPLPSPFSLSPLFPTLSSTTSPLAIHGSPSEHKYVNCGHPATRGATCGHGESKIVVLA